MLTHVQLFGPHEPQHTRLLCPPLSPRICSSSCALSQWCYPTHFILCPPLLLLLQFFPASESFPMSQFFASGSQSIGASASASVLPMNIQEWFPLGLTDLISFQSRGLSRIFFSTTIQNHQLFGVSLLYGSTLTSVHNYWKNPSFDYMFFVGKMMSLHLNMLSRFVIAFLPMSKSQNTD